MPRDPDSLTRPGEADLEMDAGQGCPGRWGTGTGRAPAARSSRWANASPRSALPAWLQFRHGLLVPLVTSFSQQNVGGDRHADPESLQRSVLLQHRRV